MDQNDDEIDFGLPEKHTEHAKRRDGVTLPRLKESKRSRGLRHALAQVKSGQRKPKNSRAPGAADRTRPAPSMPKLPWND